MNPREDMFSGEQQNTAAAFEQMIRANCNMQAYKNIIQAAKDAGKSDACKKSAAELAASIKNHIHVCTRELSARLNGEEKVIVEDILLQVKDVLNVAMVQTASINDASLDKETKEQRKVELTNYVKEQLQQLAIKIAPFGIVLQDEQVQDEQAQEQRVLEGQEGENDNLDEAISQMNSFLDSILSKFKKD